MVFKKTALCLALVLSVLPQVFAVGEIRIEDVFVKTDPPDRYTVGATVSNQTDKPREVTLRAQIFFFEKASPKTDKPAMILRKDLTLVLRKNESRKIRVRLLNEGTLPKERLRLEPEIRIRRQREWHH